MEPPRWLTAPEARAWRGYRRMRALLDQMASEREAIIDAFEKHFRSRYAAVDSELRPSELERAEELVRTKFAHPDWIGRIP
jgi:lipoate-protein ligase A